MRITHKIMDLLICPTYLILFHNPSYPYSVPLITFSAVKQIYKKLNYEIIVSFSKLCKVV